MLLTCPNCGTQYDVDESAIGPSGRMVRCEKCAHRWRAMPPGAAPQLAPGGMAPPPPQPNPEATQWGAPPPMGQMGGQPGMQPGFGGQPQPGMDQVRDMLNQAQNQPDPAANYGYGQPQPGYGQQPYGHPGFGGPQGGAQPPAGFAGQQPGGAGWAPQQPVAPAGMPPMPGNFPQQPGAAYGAQPAGFDAPAAPVREPQEKKGRSKRRESTKPYDRDRAMRRQVRKDRRRERTKKQRRRSSWLTLLAFIGVFGGILVVLYQYDAEVTANYPQIGPAIANYVNTVDTWTADVTAFFSGLFSEVSDAVDEG